MIGFNSYTRFRDHTRRLRIKQVRFNSWVHTSPRGRKNYVVTILN